MKIEGLVRVIRLVRTRSIEIRKAHHDREPLKRSQGLVRPGRRIVLAQDLKSQSHAKKRPDLPHGDA